MTDYEERAQLWLEFTFPPEMLTDFPVTPSLAASYREVAEEALKRGYRESDHGGSPAFRRGYGVGEMDGDREGWRRACERCAKGCVDTEQFPTWKSGCQEVGGCHTACADECKTIAANYEEPT